MTFWQKWAIAMLSFYWVGFLVLSLKDQVERPVTEFDLFTVAFYLAVAIAPRKSL